MSKERWSVIRIAKTTHERLKAFRDQLAEDYAAGRVVVPDEYVEHIPLDYVLTLLLDRVEDHRNRAKKQRSKGKTDVRTAIQG